MIEVLLAGMLLHGHAQHVEYKAPKSRLAAIKRVFLPKPWYCSYCGDKFWRYRKGRIPDHLGHCVATPEEVTGEPDEL